MPALRGLLLASVLGATGCGRSVPDAWPRSSPLSTDAARGVRRDAAAFVVAEPEAYVAPTAGGDAHAHHHHHGAPR